MPRYLVIRKDGVHENGRRTSIRSTEVWPAIVEANSAEEAPKEAYRQFFPGSELPLNRVFVVVSMDLAWEVIHRPIRNYETIVSEYDRR